MFHLWSRAFVARTCRTFCLCQSSALRWTVVNYLGGGQPGMQMIVPNQEHITVHFQNEQANLHEGAQIFNYKSHAWNNVPHELPVGYYNCNLLDDGFDANVTFLDFFSRKDTTKQLIVGE